ncbi:hypothetical protein Tsubulata_042775 [Turnera subulata]|uniref:Uncharacterized protein n=1 Tax=Turnera subulata TaxID=218843 RepID=A0A9Q0J816_9ROSI|nr:hypothetical protein Tsubulata_042775 [Turnera subulata]
MYGDRVEDNSAAYVSLFIALVSEGTDVRALFQLTLLDQSGKERQKGTPAILQKSLLETSDYLKRASGLRSKWVSTLMSQHLLVVADIYALDRLRLLCEANLCEDVAINTVATTSISGATPLCLAKGCLSQVCCNARKSKRYGAEAILDGSDVNGRRVKLTV